MGHRHLEKDRTTERPVRLAKTRQAEGCALVPSLPATPGFTRFQERVPPTRHIIGRPEMNDSQVHEREGVGDLAWLRPGAVLIGRYLQPRPPI